MIKIDGVSYSYTPGKPVLKGVSLYIDKRPTAIIGQNGAGKTTLVKLLKGLLKPESGTISIMGEDISGKTVAKLAKTIGLVFQNPNDQIFKHNVLDEVMFGPINVKMSRDEASARTKAALETAGLWEKRGMNPHDLSLSEKKLLCIASVIAMDTDIVILDEPTIAQDHIGKSRIKEIIRGLIAQDKLVMTIIHDMDFVAECFERTIVMNMGEVLLVGDTKNVFSDAQTLKQARVEQPHIARLSESLGLGVCLTEEEFAEEYKKKKGG